MLVNYIRAGGMKPPPDNESLNIENDGSFCLWRSVGWATYPPTPVGLFTGTLEPAVLTGLKAEIAAANTAGSMRDVPMPGSPVEVIVTASAKAEMLDYVTLPDGWKDLAERLRGLLRDLTGHPRAALELRYLPDQNEANLVQLGPAELTLDLSEFKVEVRHLSKKTYSTVATWTGEQNLGKVSAKPGWSLNLPFDHGFSLTADSLVRVFATLALFDGDRWIPVSIQALLDPAELEDA